MNFDNISCSMLKSDFSAANVRSLSNVVGSTLDEPNPLKAYLNISAIDLIRMQESSIGQYTKKYVSSLLFIYSLLMGSSLPKNLFRARPATGKIWVVFDY